MKLKVECIAEDPSTSKPNDYANILRLIASVILHTLLDWVVIKKIFLLLKKSNIL